MTKLGVDFGTTRTLVAGVDRGNYPVVTFLDPVGEAHEHFPSVVAELDGQLLYGLAALDAATHKGAVLLRSFKRLLAAPDVSGSQKIEFVDVDVTLFELLTGYLTALRVALIERSNLVRKKNDLVFDAVIAVPAHAHGAQRFLTLEAFRAAGFSVRAMINEPSAAGFEYSHRQARTVNTRRTRVVVYDLGGGTFDASLVKVDGTRHEVTGTAGLNRVGGDDFDMVLFRLALTAAGVDDASLSARERATTLMSCREAKERLTAQSKRVFVDVKGAEIAVAVDEYFAAVTPLVEATVTAMRPLLGSLEPALGGTPAPGEDKSPDVGADIAGIYLVGGGSGLPLVPRLLKERFGRRVHRSPHPAASTAIGLAIAADEDAGFSLADRLSRGFGVFRDKNAGQGVAFDPIFLPDVALPEVGRADGGVVISRRYRAAHNLGCFRFVECSSVDDVGDPRGDLLPFAEVLFPFDPALQRKKKLDDVVIERLGSGPRIEERYTIDPHGLVEVQIIDVDTGYQQTHRIGR
ncbi:MAG: Hsp70 family protein [Deltaproteobacteria bacterium]|nr:Hsp70 family protein [Deltaproteobacteria bacterium]